MKKITDFKVGDTASITHVITERDLQRFVELTGDDNKLHVDKDFARQTSFKQPVVHGALGASFISTVIGTKLPGDGALWFSQSIDFLLPVRVGDTLSIKVEVVTVLEKQNMLELAVEILNQYKQAVTKGICKVKLIAIEQEKPGDGDKGITNKVALVVGATGGIGMATCIGLARQGFDIVVHYNRQRDLAMQLKEKLDALNVKTLVVKADIGDASQVKAMFESIRRHFDVITVMVNCSTGQIASCRFAQLGWEDVQSHIDVNVKGSFHLMKEAMPIMESRRYGKIINLTSLAVDSPNPEWLGYITAKAALEGFTRALAVELAPKGIRLNLVSPGMTETDLISNIPEKTRLIVGAGTPLRRIARPEDVAQVICFLASQESDFLTGETIRVNGGKLMI